jgi:hypothetical protein
MKTHHHPGFRHLVPAGALLFAVVSFGQTPVLQEAADASPAQAIASRFTEALLASLPPFDPQASVLADRSREKALIDRDADKPANNIVRLPVYVVHGTRPPIFRERDVLTQRGLGDLAQKRYISRFDHVLNDHPIPFFGATTEDRALAMYAEDERLEKMADLGRAARNLARIDPAAGAELRRLANETYMRRSDVGVDIR